ncbi:hypothetical protein LTR08_002698 [Meristemomyces frigidus]|nr:hypothetical protein LTR08_002698 [Meristemomyces frigidus]
MGAGDRSRWGISIQDLLLFAATAISLSYLTTQLLARLDPDAGAKAEAQQKSRAATKRLQSIFSPQDPDDAPAHDRDSDSDSDPCRPPSHQDRLRSHELVLTPYEQTIAMSVVAPADIPVGFDDIGGLEPIIDDLRESVIYPLTLPHLYTSHSSLLTAPSGVLLYGPPGCGKTMLAKALARESGACFINLHISTLTEKWYGDSNKLVAAVFSLARKLQPAIVFIDEIDAVLGQRRSGEHEASGMVKAEFMTHWDGLASSTTADGAQRICILGATNRIQDIDEAILRRLPKKFAVGLPNARQRKQIFELTLKGTKLDTSSPDHYSRTATTTTPFDLPALVRLSAGMSGSDIKEACRDAAMVPVREYIRAHRAAGRSMRGGIRGEEVRGLQTDDFFGRRAGVEEERRRGEIEGGEVEEGEIEEGGVVGEEGSVGSASTEEVESFDDPEEVGIGLRR